MADRGGTGMVYSWLNIVVDIEPRSRFSILPDVGHMTISGPGSGFGFIGAFSPTITQDVYPAPAADDPTRHTLSLTVPPAGVDVAKGGLMTVIVLFPQSTPGYRVRVDASATDPPPTDIIDIGGRTAAVWNLEQDPDFDIDYIYDVIMHEE